MRIARIEEKRNLPGKNARAEQLARQLVTPDIGEWGRAKWREVGRRFGQQFKWSWSRFFVEMLVAADQQYGNATGAAVALAFARFQLPARKLVGME